MTAETETSPLDLRGERLARLITEVFAPGILVMVVLLVVGAASGPSILVGAVWGAVAAMFCGAIPYGFMIIGARQGKLGDRHIRDRRQRLLPLAFSIASVIIGCVALLVAHGPRPVLALVLTMLSALTIFSAITTVWKVSFHAGVAAGDVVILTVVFGPTLLLVLPVAILVAWARVRIKDHTSAQVTAGAFLGAAICGLMFSILR